MVFVASVFSFCKEPEIIVYPCYPGKCTGINRECIDGECQCVDGAIEFWLKTNGIDSEQVCVMPSKTTFVAYFEPFECLTPFPVIFQKEPLGPDPPTMVRTPLQSGGCGSSVVINQQDPKGVFVSFGVCSVYQCYDYRFDDQGRPIAITGGSGPISFRGRFTHPDTISGGFRFSGPS